MMGSHKAAVCVEIFILMCLFAGVLSDRWCFACLSYDEDDPARCSKREHLLPRRCISVHGENVTCVKYSAIVHLEEKINEEYSIKDHPIHGFYCGTKRSCDLNVCPENWHKTTTDCDITCCDGSESCPLPTPRDIAHVKGVGKGSGSTKFLAQGETGARGADAVRVVWCDWLKAVSFAVFGWFRLFQ